MSEPKYAFQCKNCGALETAEQAGENHVPRACHVCGHGVRYEAKGSNFSIVQEPENWIVLADLKPEQLEKVSNGRLKPEHVIRHTVKKSAPIAGAMASVEAKEAVAAADISGGDK